MQVVTRDAESDLVRQNVWDHAPPAQCENDAEHALEIANKLLFEIACTELQLTSGPVFLLACLGKVRTHQHGPPAKLGGVHSCLSR